MAPIRPAGGCLRHLTDGRAVAPEGAILSPWGALMERTAPASTPVLVNVETRTMLCPRGKREQPLRDDVMLGMRPSYVSQRVSIYCRGSRSRLFALRSGPLGED